MVTLQAIDSQISVLQTDPFSVTWVGTLKPQFQACRATAGRPGLPLAVKHQAQAQELRSTTLDHYPGVIRG